MSLKKLELNYFQVIDVNLHLKKRLSSFVVSTSSFRFLFSKTFLRARTLESSFIINIRNLRTLSCRLILRSEKSDVDSSFFEHCRKVSFMRLFSNSSTTSLNLDNNPRRTFSEIYKKMVLFTHSTMHILYKS